MDRSEFGAKGLDLVLWYSFIALMEMQVQVGVVILGMSVKLT